MDDVEEDSPMSNANSGEYIPNIIPNVFFNNDISGRRRTKPTFQDTTVLDRYKENVKRDCSQTGETKVPTKNQVCGGVHYSHNIQRSAESSNNTTGSQPLSIKIKIYDILRRTWNKDSVTKVRLFCDVRDALADSENDKKATTIGSISEGFYRPTTVIDIIFALTWIDVVYNNTNTRMTIREAVVEAEFDHSYSGFVFLKIVSGLDFALFEQCCVKQEGSNYLSSHLFKLYMAEQSGTKTKFKGNRFFDLDETFSFMFGIQSLWPVATSDFSQRKRKFQWPTKTTVSTIVENGVILVPLGQPLASKKMIHWQVSYVIAEKILVRSFTYVQFLTYALMKMVVVEHFKFCSSIDEFSPGYIVRTVIFWVVEETIGSSWTIKNFLKNFYMCFERMKHFIASEFCPNYFIPTQNVLESHIPPMAMLVLRKLETPLESDLFNLVQSQLSTSLSCNISSHSNLLQDPIQSVNPIITLLPFLQMASSSVDLQRFLPLTISKIISNILNPFVQNLLCYHLAGQCQMGSHLIQIPSGSNKATYNVLRFKLCLLLVGKHTDFVSGWLLLAINFYNLKQHNLCSVILQYIEELLNCDERMLNSEWSDNCFIKKRNNRTSKAGKQRFSSRILKQCVIQPLFIPPETNLMPEGSLNTSNADFSHLPSHLIAYYLKFLCSVKNGNAMLCPEILIRAQESNYTSGLNDTMQLIAKKIFEVMEKQLFDQIQ